MGLRFSKNSEPASSNGPASRVERQTTQNFSARLTKKQSQKFSHIGDQYKSLDQVTEALRLAGLESSNLIVGIDFTKSNEWTGKHSFNGRSLHSVGSTERNPYEQAMYILGRTLSAFDDDNLIPCFGFGDVTTHDQCVFSFYPDQQPCEGFEQALTRYREIVPYVRLAGPTSFAPIIETAIDIVEQSGGQYHVLLIIADGQVTRSVDTEDGLLSPQERNTIEAIVTASEYALSIILVGVGDGPWDTMKQFDDNIPRRAFDNFQFVNFTQIMSRNGPEVEKEAAFALAALMEIPSQFKATMELDILNRPKGSMPNRAVLPPPPSVLQHDNQMSSYPHYSFNQSKYHESTGAVSGGRWNSGRNSFAETQSGRDTSSDAQVCPVCLTEPKDMAFNCGHQTCKECAEDLIACPLCRQTITTRLRLY